MEESHDCRVPRVRIEQLPRRVVDAAARWARDNRIFRALPELPSCWAQRKNRTGGCRAMESEHRIYSPGTLSTASLEAIETMLNGMVDRQKPLGGSAMVKVWELDALLDLARIRKNSSDYFARGK